MKGKSLGPTSKVVVGADPDIKAFTGSMWLAKIDTYGFGNFICITVLPA